MKHETSFGNYFKLPNPGLRSYFSKVRRGQPEEYRTPFANKDPVGKVLAEWESTVQTLKNTWPTLLDYENDMKAKVGPLSIEKPLAERLEDIDHYYDDVKVSSTSISEDAVAAVVDEFKCAAGMRVRSAPKTLERMKLSTNSGSPYFTKRRNVKDLTLSGKLITSELQQGRYQLLDRAYDYCAVLGWRGQEGGPLYEDVKQRVVWMFPFLVNLHELRLYQVLIESCQRFNLVPAWVSMDNVDREITQLFDTKGRSELVICTDFSKFDQHFNHDMQEGALHILDKLFTPNSDYTSWTKDVFPIKYEIPLAYDYGKIRFGTHGMGSGSGGTNADETLAHRALQHEAALNKSVKLNLHSMCLGDDGVLSYPGINIDDVMRSYTAHGQEMNEDKQYVSTQDCVYLRRWHHTDYRVRGVCVGVYSTYRALGRLMEQERFYDPDKWSKEMVALRQLSILENCKWHPLKEKFVEFCMKRDKYRLGLDIPGFLPEIASYAKEATDYMPDFLGYTKSLQNQDPTAGIENWWIVNYLRHYK
uniref:RNA-dependent RNA polymerase n=1 Tax=Rabbit picobirnavirus 8 TaxID=2716682 RepID=A0A6G7PSQ9_9VIRU|nr:RNA-dependent RNA polymerase [Rabbit picobirnavirus 8]